MGNKLIVPRRFNKKVDIPGMYKKIPPLSDAPNIETVIAAIVDATVMVFLYYLKHGRLKRQFNKWKILAN